jgi:riboflavin synthase
MDVGSFEVALVPHTLWATTLGEAAPGREVNVEVDVLAKYVERMALPWRAGANDDPEATGYL